MGGIKENVCICKARQYSRRWKNECRFNDWRTVQVNDLRNGILDGMCHGKETPAQSPK